MGAAIAYYRAGRIILLEGPRLPNPSRLGQKIYSKLFSSLLTKIFLIRYYCRCTILPVLNVGKHPPPTSSHNRFYDGDCAKTFRGNFGKA